MGPRHERRSSKLASLCCLAVLATSITAAERMPTPYDVNLHGALAALTKGFRLAYVASSPPYDSSRNGRELHQEESSTTCVWDESAQSCQMDPASVLSDLQNAPEENKVAKFMMCKFYDNSGDCEGNGMCRWGDPLSNGSGYSYGSSYTTETPSCGPEGLEFFQELSRCYKDGSLFQALFSCLDGMSSEEQEAAIVGDLLTQCLTTTSPEEMVKIVDRDPLMRQTLRCSSRLRQAECELDDQCMWVASAAECMVDIDAQATLMLRMLKQGAGAICDLMYAFMHCQSLEEDGMEACNFSQCSWVATEAEASANPLSDAVSQVHQQDPAKGVSPTNPHCLSNWGQTVGLIFGDSTAQAADYLDNVKCLAQPNSGCCTDYGTTLYNAQLCTAAAGSLAAVPSATSSAAAAAGPGEASADPAASVSSSFARAGTGEPDASATAEEQVASFPSDSSQSAAFSGARSRASAYTSTSTASDELSVSRSDADAALPEDLQTAGFASSAQVEALPPAGSGSGSGGGRRTSGAAVAAIVIASIAIVAAASWGAYVLLVRHPQRLPAFLRRRLPGSADVAELRYLALEDTTGF